MICEFTVAHPDVNIELDFSDRRIDLIAEGMDLAVRVTSELDDTVVARRGEREAARAARDELGAERGFERCDLAGDHRARETELGGDGGETARLRNPYEHLHGGEFVHCCESCNS